jgi:protoporphyrinogen IX oxidase
MKISIAFHIIGIVFWLGGLLVLSRVMKGLVLSGIDKAGYAPIVKRVFYGFVLPGFIISLISGTFQILANGGFGVYVAQGWFHGKLTFVVVLLIVTFLLGREISKLSAGNGVSTRALGMIHGITSLALIVIVFLTIVRG